MAQKQEKTDLMQGTLDLLILRTLRAGTKHGYAVPTISRKPAAVSCKSRRARCTRLCIAWSGAVGSKPNGDYPKPSARQSIIGSRMRAAHSLSENKDVAVSRRCDRERAGSRATEA